jgi:hypothetical protein
MLLGSRGIIQAPVIINFSLDSQPLLRLQANFFDRKKTNAEREKLFYYSGSLLTNQKCLFSLISLFGRSIVFVDASKVAKSKKYLQLNYY